LFIERAPFVFGALLYNIHVVRSLTFDERNVAF
jgi:hypothetical protein